jgi:tRNA modification GTPase
MSDPTRPTIFALSSGAPPSGVAVIRISGPAAGAALRALAGRVPPPRRAGLAMIRGADGTEIDRGLALFFPGPASVTGEDVAELHLHGGRAVIAAALQALAVVPGLIPAEPGAFTRRAFDAGRLDLTAVEGLADLIAAETEAQRRQALRQMEGALARRAESWRARLVRARALIEAELDFADEEDVPRSQGPVVAAEAARLAAELQTALADAGRGERLREGYVVVLAGPPNAGKSTLLNALAQREVAIVTDIPGTTRDALEVRLDLGGLPVTTIDTAGIRETAETIEAEGVRRALARAATADLVLWLSEDGAAAPSPDIGGATPTWPVRTKIDRTDGAAPDPGDAGRAAAISALTGAGVAALTDRVAAFLRRLVPPEGGAMTRARHRACLVDAIAALETVRPGMPGELAAEALRQAGDALARLVGRIDVEDVLDVIFAEFCIGK